MKVLFLVTDFSFVSGDHIYVAKLVCHLSKLGKFDIHVAELGGHGGWQNVAIYDAMKDLGVELHSMSDYRGCCFALERPRFLQTVINSIEPDIIHSHHFATDLTAMICLLGSERYAEELSKLTYASHFSSLAPLIITRSRPENVSMLLPDLLPIEGWPIPRNIEAGHFFWVSTKHATEAKSFANVAVVRSTFSAGSLEREASSALNTQLQKLVSEHCHRIVTINDAATKAWRELGIKSDTIYVAAIGDSERKTIEAAQLKRNQVREYLGIHKDGLGFLFASRMSTKKQPTVLAEAFIEHLYKHPKDTLIFVGDGPKLNECRNIIEQENRIRVLGYRPRHELFSIMGAVDACCLFSLEEGMPLSIMEAMASGLPVLVTPIGGMPEIVWDGFNGCMSTGTSKEDVIDVLERFACLTAEERNRYGKGARNTMKRYVDEVSTFGQYVDIYSKLMPLP